MGDVISLDAGGSDRETKPWRRAERQQQARDAFQGFSIAKL